MEVPAVRTVSLHHSWILGVIINRDFLDGITKRKMREDLGKSFPLRVVVDLNGDVKGNIADENVFEIEQGVTLALLSTNHPSESLRFRSLVGTRADKYRPFLRNYLSTGRFKKSFLRPRIFVGCHLQARTLLMCRWNTPKGFESMMRSRSGVLVSKPRTTRFVSVGLRKSYFTEWND